MREDVSENYMRMITDVTIGSGEIVSDLHYIHYVAPLVGSLSRTVTTARIASRLRGDSLVSDTCENY